MKTIEPGTIHDAVFTILGMIVLMWNLKRKYSEDSRRLLLTAVKVPLGVPLCPSKFSFLLVHAWKVPGSSSHPRETWLEFLALGFGLAQPQRRKHLESEPVGRTSVFLCLSKKTEMFLKAPR